ncbi:hypothetical protein [Pelagibius sp.]|uniref:hypothetical protein n=1 Tax=Pelagibius sp. TaxID=1931238 RepID=UPI003B5146F8
MGFDVSFLVPGRQLDGGAYGFEMDSRPVEEAALPGKFGGCAVGKTEAASARPILKMQAIVIPSPAAFFTSALWIHSSVPVSLF